MYSFIVLRSIADVSIGHLKTCAVGCCYGILECYLALWLCTPLCWFNIQLLACNIVTTSYFSDEKTLCLMKGEYNTLIKDIFLSAVLGPYRVPFRQANQWRQDGNFSQLFPWDLTLIQKGQGGSGHSTLLNISEAYNAFNNISWGYLKSPFLWIVNCNVL